MSHIHNTLLNVFVFSYFKISIYFCLAQYALLIFLPISILRHVLLLQDLTNWCIYMIHGMLSNDCKVVFFVNSSLLQTLQNAYFYCSQYCNILRSLWSKMDVKNCLIFKHQTSVCVS